MSTLTTWVLGVNSRIDQIIFFSFIWWKQGCPESDSARLLIHLSHCENKYLWLMVWLRTECTFAYIFGDTDVNILSKWTYEFYCNIRSLATSRLNCYLDCTYLCCSATPSSLNTMLQRNEAVKFIALLDFMAARITTLTYLMSVDDGCISLSLHLFSMHFCDKTATN